MSGGIRVLVLPITAISTVLTARITIGATGVEVYGYVNTIALLFQLFPFADLGVGAAVSTSVARAARSEEERTYAVRTVLGAVRILTCTSFAGIIGVVVLMQAEIWPTFLGIPSSYNSEANVAVALSLIVFFASVPMGVGQRLLIGSGRSDLLAAAGVLVPVVALLFVLLADVFAMAPFYFALGSPIALLITNSVCTVLGLRQAGIGIKELTSRFLTVRTFPGGAIFLTAWPMLMVSMFFAMTMQSHRLILAHFDLVYELSAYALVAQIFFPAWSVVYMSSNTLWAEFSRNEKRPQLWLRSNLVLTGIGLGGAAVLVILGGFIVKLMSSGGVIVSDSLLWWFGGLLVVLSLHSTQSNLLTSPTWLRSRATMSFLTLIGFILMALCLTPVMGAAGPVAATLVAYGVFQMIPGLFIGYRITKAAK